MAFIGREKEINKINRIINKESLSLSLIYGRRRVGKSELIKHILLNNDIRSIYYEAKQTTESNNVQSISTIISDVLNMPKLSFNDFEDVASYLCEISKEESLILVIDEYPYLRENIKGLDSIFQTIIDKYRDISKIKIIILGSYVDVMKNLLEHSNPLFGRVDLTINLKPMDYYESSLFYPSFSLEDKVRLYSVFGGIPYYNQLIDETKTVKENIIDLIASNDARLENEITMYLKSEISKMVNANETFEALARGFSKYSDILSQSKVSSGSTLIDILNKLIRMEVVEKAVPINDKTNSKSSYYISDNLSSFYYRYIFRYLSQMKIMDSDIFYEKYIEKDFEELYVPHKFEQIAKEYLIRKNLKGEINPLIEKIGKYYYNDPKKHKNGEFDVVTYDENGYAFYEVKFKSKPLSKSEIIKEISQVNETGVTCYKYVFVTRNGIDMDVLNNDEYLIEHISLSDIYGQGGKL